jgi:hypothetical protein
MSDPDDLIAPTPTQVRILFNIVIGLYAKFFLFYLKQPTQIMQATLVKPLRATAKTPLLMDHQQYTYRRHADYKAGKPVMDNNFHIYPKVSYDDSVCFSWLIHGAKLNYGYGSGPGTHCKARFWSGTTTLV